MSGSIGKASLPSDRALNDEQIAAHLAPYERYAIIELSNIAGTFCGFRDRRVDTTFAAESERLLHYQRTPFCMMEGSDNAPLFSQCCYPRKPGDKFFPVRAQRSRPIPSKADHPDPLNCHPSHPDPTLTLGSHARPTLAFDSACTASTSRRRCPHALADMALPYGARA